MATKIKVWSDSDPDGDIIIATSLDDAKNENEDSNLFRGSGNFSSDEAKELTRLKKENRDLKDAVEILKKAMSIISSQ